MFFQDESFSSLSLGGGRAFTQQFSGSNPIRIIWGLLKPAHPRHQKFSVSSRSRTVTSRMCFSQTPQEILQVVPVRCCEKPHPIWVSCLTLFRAHLTAFSARPLISRLCLPCGSCYKRPEVSCSKHGATHKASQSHDGSAQLTSKFLSFALFSREWYWQTSNLTLTL